MTLVAESNGHRTREQEQIEARQLWDELGQPKARQLAEALPFQVPERTLSSWVLAWRQTAPAAVPAVPRQPAAVPRQPAAVPRPRPRQPRPPTPEPGRDHVTWWITAAVAAVCAAVSYSHIVELALLSGAGWWAWVLPIPLDGMMAAAVRQRRWWVAGCAIFVGFAASAAANAFSQRPELVDLELVRPLCALSFPASLLVCVLLLERSKQ